MGTQRWKWKHSNITIISVESNMQVKGNVKAKLELAK